MEGGLVPEISSLVYAYLSDQCEEVGEIYRKIQKVVPPPPGSPSLEDIISAYTDMYEQLKDMVVEFNLAVQSVNVDTKASLESYSDSSSDPDSSSESSESSGSLKSHKSKAVRGPKTAVAESSEKQKLETSSLTCSDSKDENSSMESPVKAVIQRPTPAAETPIDKKEGSLDEAESPKTGEKAVATAPANPQQPKAKKHDNLSESKKVVGKVSKPAVPAKTGLQNYFTSISISLPGATMESLPFPNMSSLVYEYLSDECEEVAEAYRKINKVIEPPLFSPSLENVFSTYSDVYKKLKHLNGDFKGIKAAKRFYGKASLESYKVNPPPPGLPSLEEIFSAYSDVYKKLKRLADDFKGTERWYARHAMIKSALESKSATTKEAQVVGKVSKAAGPGKTTEKAPAKALEKIVELSECEDSKQPVPTIKPANEEQVGKKKSKKRKHEKENEEAEGKFKEAKKAEVQLGQGNM